ncbi:MAG TPA: hypothetical protein VF815_18245 [Myxococcaceae bacterium]
MLFIGSLAFAARRWGSFHSMPLWLLVAGALGAGVTFMLAMRGQSVGYSMDQGYFKLGGALGFFLGGILGLWLVPLAVLLGAVRMLSERPLSAATVFAATVACAVAAIVLGWMLVAQLGTDSAHPPKMLALFLCCLGVASAGLSVVVPLVVESSE